MFKKKSWRLLPTPLFKRKRKLVKSPPRPASPSLSTPKLTTADEPKGVPILPLLGFPNEILLLIAENLEDPSHIYRLIRTNRRLACLLTPLLHKHADTSRAGIPALHWAAERGHKELVRLLLKRGVDVDTRDPMYRGWTALHLAARYHEPIVRLLLESGADVSVRDRFDETALHRATDKINNEVTVRLLLEAGADIGAQDFLGNTPLHRAVRQDPSMPARLLALLLEMGADASVKNISGMTALHQAVQCQSPVSLTLLLTKGVDININDVDMSGRTALHYAVKSGNSCVLEAMLSHHPEINIQDGDGSTALHWAVKAGSRYHAQLLMENGANTSIMDINGRTPGTLARALGRGFTIREIE